MQIIRRNNARLVMNEIRLQSRVSWDPRRGRRVEIGFLDTDKVYRMERDKVEKCSTSGSKTSGVPLKNPE